MESFGTTICTEEFNKCLQEVEPIAPDWFKEEFLEPGKETEILWIRCINHHIMNAFTGKVLVSSKIY